MAFVRGEPSTRIAIGSVGKFVAKSDKEYLSWRFLFDEVYFPVAWDFHLGPRLEIAFESRPSSCYIS
jgi:hypothetical protein